MAQILSSLNSRDVSKLNQEKKNQEVKRIIYKAYSVILKSWYSKLWMDFKEVSPFLTIPLC